MGAGAERSQRELIPVTIASGAALSGEVSIGAGQIVGIQMPAAWTAATLTFQALLSEPSALPKVPVWGNVTDSAGAEVSIAAAAGIYITVPNELADHLRALGRIRVRSGTAGVPVNQAAERALALAILV